MSELLPYWPGPLLLAGHFVAGWLLGLLHFRGLWWNTRMLAGGGRAMAAIGLMIGRFVLLGGLLAAASLEGALPLLMMALGVCIARPMVMRAVRRTAP